MQNHSAFRVEDTLITIATLAAAALFVGGLIWIAYCAHRDKEPDGISENDWWAAKMREFDLEAREVSSAELAEALRNHDGRVIVAIKKPKTNKEETK